MLALSACAVTLMGCGTLQSQAVQKSRSSQASNFNSQEIAATNAETSKVGTPEVLAAETPQQTDAKTISNGNWTVTIANINSWSGVNGTGNLSYHGCDSQGKCIDLTNGTISCRNGICITGWKNGDYVYAIAEPISESTQSQSSKTTLTVRKNDTEILRESGFSAVRQANSRNGCALRFSARSHIKCRDRQPASALNHQPKNLVHQAL